MPFGIMFAGLVIGGLFPWYGATLLFGPEKSNWIVGSAWAITGVVIGFGLFTKRNWFRPMGLSGAALLIVEGLRQILSRGAVIDHVLVVAGVAAFIGLVVPATGRAPSPVGASPPTRNGYASRVLALCGIVGLTAHIAWGARTGSSSEATNGQIPVGEVAVRPNVSGAQEASIAPSDPAVSGTAPSPDSGATHAAQGIQWASFSIGLAEAKTRQTPVFVEFYATWCGACKSMDRNAFRDARVARKLRDLVAVRVNAEEQTPRDGLKGVDLANRFRVEAYPTLLVLDSKGKELARLVGAPDAPGFLRWLEGAVTGASGAGSDSGNRAVRVAKN